MTRHGSGRAERRDTSMAEVVNQAGLGKNIAVIPARGGSKRISRKNVKPFCGKPILAYSIAAARASRLFEKIVVSTDDEEIAAIARQWGAITPFLRPAALADDYVGTNAVAAHAAQWFLDRNIAVDHVCCLYATAPFVQPRFLVQGLETLLRRRCRFVFSATTFPAPLRRAIRLDSDGWVAPYFPESMAARSQDLEEAYHDAGQFYWGSPEAFSQAALFGPGSAIVALPRHLVQDIDTPEDWLRAECMYKTLRTMGDLEICPFDPVEPSYSSAV